MHRGTPRPARLLPGRRHPRLLVTAHRATQARNEAPGPVHVHYDQANDTFTVIRADPQENPA
ncbi:hypothetical protein G3I28_00330 [Streptomyces sp. SID10116]|uniref:hypothetical protein n=1 Tax=Streptomyces sp. SID10115 TaxID=2706016 RepID=UPI0013B8EA6C|nr:hypothetical protein [Streptomyces sp. SID10115]NDZ97792.1 hypothetical protein [Streptomyces sp. SID10116]